MHPPAALTSVQQHPGDPAGRVDRIGEHSHTAAGSKGLVQGFRFSAVEADHGDILPGFLERGERGLDRGHVGCERGRCPVRPGR